MCAYQDAYSSQSLSDPPPSYSGKRRAAATLKVVAHITACKSATRACPPQAYRAAPRPAHRRAEARRWRRRGRSSRRASAARRQLVRRLQAHRRAASSSSRSARAGAPDGAPGGELTSSSAARAERQSTPKPKGASCGLPCLSVGVRTGLRALGAKHCAFEFAPAQHCARPLLRVSAYIYPPTPPYDGTERALRIAGHRIRLKAKAA